MDKVSNMENMDFQPVEVTKSFLGIKKGTVLVFDSASSKYISREREEEVGDNYEYYSGYAIDLDPVVVERNLGKYFEFYDEPEVEIEAPIEEVVNESNEELVNSGPYEVESRETEAVSTEKEVDSFNPPTNEVVVKPAELVFECGLCHYTTKITDIKYGLFFPASTETSLTMKCENCGISTVLGYRISDETTEESK